MITIKPDYRNTVIGFNNSGIVLSERSQGDLIDLAILAHSSADPSIVELFETLPSLDALKKAKMEGFIKKPNHYGETKTK